MNDLLMDRYQALSDMVEYPTNYAALWERLAIDFAIDSRFAMSAKCRHNAERYSKVKINDKPAVIVGKMEIKHGGDKVVYLEVV